MKSIYNIWVFIVCLTLASCYEEDPITPTDSGNTGRFEFPQGDNSWDDDIYDIYNKFGVRLIYKDITEKEFTKSWTSGSGGMGIALHGTGSYSNEMTQFYVTFMKDHIFQYLNPQITEKVFPMYWYLTFDFYGAYSWMPTLWNPLKSHSDLGFLDAWLTCFWGQHVNFMVFDDTGNLNPLEQWQSPISGNKESYSIRRFLIINDVIEGAIERGNIVMPEEFDTGFDHTTKLVTNDFPEDKLDPNYYIARGYPGNINTSSAKYSKPVGTYPSSAEKTFLGYVQILMRLNAEERESTFSLSNYPFAKEKFDFVRKYMRDKYNIDTEAIANGPENWDITPYPELPAIIVPEM